MPLSVQRAGCTISRQALVVCWVAVLSTGCRATTEPRDVRACQQTYEFGNTGCFEISGQVVGLRGQPLAGISVGPRYLAGRAAFSSAFVTTDVAGAFRFRASRMAGPPAPAPDTLSLWVVGTDPATAGVNVPARVRDSVLVQAMVSPVGTIPTPSIVRLTLAVP